MAASANSASAQTLWDEQKAKADVLNALHFQTAPSSDWTPKVLTISAKENKGITEVWTMIQLYQKHAISTGYFEENRENQKSRWLDESVDSYFKEFMNRPYLAKSKKQLLENKSFLILFFVQPL